MAIQHRDKYCRCKFCKRERASEKHEREQRAYMRKYNAAKRKASVGQKKRNRSIQGFGNKVVGRLRKAVFGFDKSVVKPAMLSFVSAGNQVFYSSPSRRRPSGIRRKKW